MVQEIYLKCALIFVYCFFIATVNGPGIGRLRQSSMKLLPEAVGKKGKISII